MKNYYISDLHFFHKNVTDEGSNFDGRPFKTLEEMHNQIIKYWNTTITNADHVYILGDLSWKENEDSIQLVSRLKGNKHLILGNHDSIKDLRYRQLFVEICNYKEIQDNINGKKKTIVLSHYPLASWEHMRKYDREGNILKNYTIHLYGHVHNSSEYEAYKKYLLMLDTEYNIQVEAYNVGSMLLDYTPRTLEYIMNSKERK